MTGESSSDTPIFDEMVKLYGAPLWPAPFLAEACDVDGEDTSARNLTEEAQSDG